MKHFFHADEPARRRVALEFSVAILTTQGDEAFERERLRCEWSEWVAIEKLSVELAREVAEFWPVPFAGKLMVVRSRIP